MIVPKTVHSARTSFVVDVARPATLPRIVKSLLVLSKVMARLVAATSRKNCRTLWLKFLVDLVLLGDTVNPLAKLRAVSQIPGNKLRNLSLLWLHGYATSSHFWVGVLTVCRKLLLLGLLNNKLLPLPQYRSFLHRRLHQAWVREPPLRLGPRPHWDLPLVFPRFRLHALGGVSAGSLGIRRCHVPK